MGSGWAGEDFGRSWAGHELGRCWTGQELGSTEVGQERKEECRIGRMQAKKGFLTTGMQGRRGSGQEGCKAGGIQNRNEAGWMQNRRDAGQE